MKKTILNIPKPLALICFTLFISGSRCSWGEQPPIENIISGYRDFSVSSVSLSYNLSGQYLDSLRLNGIPTILDDYYYINSYHPGLYMTSGTITSFGDILVENMDYSSCEKRPCVKFTFWHPSYSRTSVREYPGYDYQLCNSNIISNAPWINERHFLDFTASTVMTPNGIQLLWQDHLVIDGTSPPTINQSMASISSAITKSGVGNSSNGGGLSSGSNPRQDVAIGEEYDPIGEGTGDSDHADLDDEGVIENTVSEDLPGGDYYVVPSDSSLVFSPILIQSVYAGGEYRDDISWNLPSRAILDPVESEDGSLLPEPSNNIGIITLE